MELYLPIILDGATGTQLARKGYDGKVCAEKWTCEHPESVMWLHGAYAEAGSDIVYAPTFQANEAKLAEAGLGGQTAEINKTLVGLSKKAVSGKSYVAGDISPIGRFIEPFGDSSFDEIYDVYLEQIRAQEEAGVDLYAVETQMTVPEARAAFLAARDTSDKPVLVSFTCNEKGKTLTGTDVTAALVIFQAMGAAAFGLNCSAGPDMVLEQIKRLSEYNEVPLIAKPNAGLPEIVDGKTVYNCPPEEFASYAERFAACGVGLFGGCCGTTEEHIAALYEATRDVEIKRPVLLSDRFPGQLVGATEKRVWLLPEGTRCECWLDCGEDIEDAIDAAMKDEPVIIGIRISSEDELERFGKVQGLIDAPLCIEADDAVLLDSALRLYQGICMYRSSLDKAAAEKIARRYGAIREEVRG